VRQHLPDATSVEACSHDQVAILQGKQEIKAGIKCVSEISYIQRHCVNFNEHIMWLGRMNWLVGHSQIIIGSKLRSKA
jgi:hypothetical protein